MVRLSVLILLGVLLPGAESMKIVMEKESMQKVMEKESMNASSLGAEVAKTGPIAPDVLHCINAAGKAIEKKGFDCKGNLVKRTRGEDELAHKIMRESPYPYCYMRMIANAYYMGASKTLVKTKDSQVRGWTATFMDRFKEYEKSKDAQDCYHWTEFFLTSQSYFKQVADVVDCGTLKDDPDMALFCAYGDKLGENTRKNQGMWQDKKGRVKKKIHPDSVKRSQDMGISIIPAKGQPKFPEAVVHAKGIFAAAPAGNHVADNFRKCGAPFVAGTSGTIWGTMMHLTPTKEFSLYGMCSDRSQIALMQFAAHLVLGGHHSWTEVCLPLQEYYEFECADDSAFRTFCALDTNANQQKPAFKGAFKDAYEKQMANFKELWETLKNSDEWKRPVTERH